MELTKKYWKGVDELNETPEFIQNRDQEFPKETSVEEFLNDEGVAESSTARRDFLKFLGFSVAAATVAACEAPVVKAIPYVNKPENVTPGMPTWYASTYYDGNSYASIMVKTREGRPIFIKGNKDYGFTRGNTNAQVIASVLGLYDSSRLTSPTKNGENEKWSVVDKEIKATIAKVKAKGGKVTLVSNSVISPSTYNGIAALAEAAGSSPEVEGGDDKFEHIQYDAQSFAGIRQANKETFGEAFIPDYDFTKAKTIVSVGADFMNGWLMSTQYTAQYGVRRNPDGDWMSKHFQFESNMSLAGSNADRRAMIKPSQQANVLAFILKAMGSPVSGVSTTLDAASERIAKEAVRSLKSSRKESIVIAGSNNKAVQILVNKLNMVLGAYSTTINMNDKVNMFMSEDDKMNKFVKSVIAGKGPDMVLFYGVNPAYSLSNGAEFAAGLKKIKNSVSFASHPDETASNCTYICPDHHALEAWNDFNPKTSHYSIAQPTIRPLHNTADAVESMMVWSDKANRGGKDSKVHYKEIQSLWKQYGFDMQSEVADWDTYWGMAVHNSVAPDVVTPASAPSFNDAALSGVASKLPKGGKTEVAFYQKAGIGVGTQANNPWLQELPDPISKVTWDNYITMNPKEMEKDGYEVYFDQESGLTLATLTMGSKKMTLPVYPSPGQALGTVGVALGYGRGANGEKIGTAAFQTKEYGGNVKDENDNPVPIGANAFAFVGLENGTMSYDCSASITKESGSYLIASTQIHNTVMARNSIVKETTLGTYESKDKSAYNKDWTLQKLDENGHHVEAPIEEFDLWDAHPVEKIGHRWAMTVDLNGCIGCGACLIACQSENNVPVVGKDEVRRGREMHWLRIDRYYASEVEAAVGSRKEHDMSKMEFMAEAEEAAENPTVVHMPMMCHHCNHAPCETVCPVAATNHSNEGLNQMAYNRCIGTRYCANNCPYKVRRFNWFNYPSYKKFTEINPAQDDLGRMVLNPDVTVRTRGVMEKCSFCVQRIQAGKLVAKSEERPVMDGDITTACSDACPTNAIVVGDWNDLKSQVRTSSDDKRAYQALEEVGVKPNVWYKTKVRNNENKDLANVQVEHLAPAHGEDHGGGHEEGHGEKAQH